jgi:hypothetical protein
MNVTQGRPASGPSGFGTDPSSAVDGADYPKSYPYIFHSSGGFQVFEITLDKPTEMSKVTIYNRRDCCSGRMTDHVVKFLDSDRKILWISPKLIGVAKQTVEFGVSKVLY